MIAKYFSKRIKKYKIQIVTVKPMSNNYYPQLANAFPISIDTSKDTKVSKSRDWTRPNKSPPGPPS